jgi:hypothetical protein
MPHGNAARYAIANYDSALTETDAPILTMATKRFTTTSTICPENAAMDIVGSAREPTRMGLCDEWGQDPGQERVREFVQELPEFK